MNSNATAGGQQGPSKKLCLLGRHRRLLLCRKLDEGCRPGVTL
jgi:hypothetical protein